MIAAAFAVVADFARSKNGRRILGGAVSVALVVGAVLLARAHWIGVGVAREKTAEAGRLQAAQQVVAKTEKAAATITARTDQQATARQTEIRTVTRTLTREVPVYVTVEADRRCDVSAGFVSLHNQAAAGVPQVPRPAGLVLDAPSGVPLSAVADVVVGNYGTALEWRDAALACRAWAREQADNWHANIRTTPATP